jgi:hypothetical protein
MPPASSEFPLTPEQENARELFIRSESLKIKAYAGAGKTSTLIALADSRSRTSLYTAFNSDIVREAGKKFPSHVKCKTTHSIAQAYVRRRAYPEEKLTRKAKPREIANHLTLPKHTDFDISFSKPLNEIAFADLVSETVKKFLLS